MVKERYRAKPIHTTDKKQWIFGTLSKEKCPNGKSFIVPDSKAKSMKNAVVVDPLTICKSSGYKDCNGNEVFTNDVIRKKDNPESGNHLVFNTEDTGFGVFDLFGCNDRCFIPIKNVVEQNGIVAGNIFDNPELKKELID